jgi:hypothetical protein
VKRWQWIFVGPAKNGQFGGLAGADSHCNAAAAGKLPGNYRAWLGHGLSAPAGPNAGFVQHDIPYIMPRIGNPNVQIAANWAKLVSGQIESAIDSDASGTKVFISGDVCHVSRLVWTNVTVQGLTASGPNCVGFGSGSINQSGRVGRLDLSDGQWTDSACKPQLCNSGLRVYCVEQ